MQRISKSSINVKVIKTHSESHNLRRDELDYTFKDLEKNNESWIAEKTSDRLKAIKEYCKEKSKRKMQTNAEPIREAVVNLKPTSTMEDVKKMCDRLKNELKIEAFQIHIHRDEGESRDNLNYHAHVVFDYQDKQKGTVLRLSKGDLYKMQDIVAESLGMERGKTSNKEHLTALEYKNKMESEKLAVLIAKNEELEKRSEIVGKNINNAVEDHEKLKNEQEKELEKLKNEQQKELKELERLQGQRQNIETEAKALIVTNMVGFVDVKKTTDNIAQLQASNVDLSEKLAQTKKGYNEILSEKYKLENENQGLSKFKGELLRYKDLTAKAILQQKYNRSFKDEFIQDLRKDADFERFYIDVEKSYQAKSPTINKGKDQNMHI